MKGYPPRLINGPEQQEEKETKGTGVYDVRPGYRPKAGQGCSGLGPLTFFPREKEDSTLVLPLFSPIEVTTVRGLENCVLDLAIDAGNRARDFCPKEMELRV